MKYRYTIILDRFAEEDYGPEDKADDPGDDTGYYHDGTDLGARVQVATELQEAIDRTGLPVGQFSVLTREVVDDNSPIPEPEKSGLESLEELDAHYSGLQAEGRPSQPKGYRKPNPIEYS